MRHQIGAAIDATAARLRELALSCDDGGLLGSEDDLVGRLGVSRMTLRQVARLLEREGLLRVRRGIKGGYFAARPTLDTVERAVSTYLDTLDMDHEDVTVVASALWVEAVRRAAGLRNEAIVTTVETLRKRLLALHPTAPFRQLMELERLVREEVFALTRARYIELIFQINVTFARDRFPTVSASDLDDHAQFVDRWRRAKLMELDAIADGDQELAALAARHSRNLWHQRVWANAAGASAEEASPSGPPRQELDREPCAS
jgi:DNA-binding GntR family transcriptional regulator